MNRNLRTWQEILEPYRNGAWDECARIARSLVDQDPYDLSTRALLASLLQRTGQDPLALIQYERLLPLAVGQGDLIRALGTQRHLDLLYPADGRHPDRYRAMQDWFRYLVDARGEAGGVAKARDPQLVFEPASLIQLPADSFTLLAERAEMRLLEMERHTLRAAAGLLWIVYFGRVRWGVATGDGSASTEHVAEEGDILFLPPGEHEARRLDIDPETPAEMICMDPALASLAPGGRRVRPEAAPVVVTGGPAPSGVPQVDLSALLADAVTAAPPPEAAAPLRSGPRPDPLAEPMLGTGSRERRKTTRMAVMLNHRAALLGEAGTRVAPVGGRVVDVSRTGMGLEFPAAQLRQARDMRPESIVHVQIALDGLDDPLLVMGRVAWVRFGRTDGADGERGRVGIEFVALPAEARTRLVHLLDAAERPAAPPA